MPRIVLSGGERTSYRSVLVKNGVQNIAINLSQLKIPTRKEFVLSENYGGAAITLYTSPEDEDVARYDEFIRTHESELSIIIGRPDYDGAWLGPKYYPVWDDVKDSERLASLMERFGRVAIPDRAVTPKTIGRIRQLQLRWGASLVGLTSKADHIEALPWEAVIVTSWTSAVRYHEVQVWDGHGLRRYPASNKVTARKQHRADIIRLGVDFDEIMEDSVDEASKLAVLSWLEYERKTFGAPSENAYDPPALDDDDETEVSEVGQVVATTVEKVLSRLADSEGLAVATRPLNTRQPDEMELLPVVGIETMIHTGGDGTEPDENGDIIHDPIPVLRTTSYSLRQCDSCYLSPVCPKFKPNASCGYNLPIELRTKDQLNAVIRVILETQAKRVLFLTLAEELEGQGSDPILSKEMDRLFNLLASAKDIQDSRDLIKFTMEGRSSKPNILHSFFPQTAVVQQQLPNPMPQRELDALLGPILDAEIVTDLETVPAG